MPMTLPPNTIEVGSNAYLFESPAGAAIQDCFISAHGGYALFVSDNPAINDIKPKFTVPAGCTVNFFADDFHQHIPAGGRVNSLKAIATTNLGLGNKPNIFRENRFTHPQECKDYVLRKNLGYHGANALNPQEQPTYLEISNALAQVSGDINHPVKWLPHFVTVRNRIGPKKSNCIFLSKLISDIRAVKPVIVNFYCANCRTVLNPYMAPKALKKAGRQEYQ